MPKRTTIFFTLLFVTGCSNIGNISNTKNIYNNEYITVHETLSTKEAQCPKYIPLPVYAALEVPLEKIKSAAAKGDHSVVLVMTKYIRELRENIAKRKKEEQLHYENYLKSCQPELK